MRCTGEAHKKHMCALKEEGQFDLIEKYSDHPTVQCKHCGARANSLEYVCAAHLEEKAPNVEGGHGSVDLEDVGKPHAGKRGRTS